MTSTTYRVARNALSSLGPDQLKKYEANKASVGVAYALWLFLGGRGAHRLYAGERNTGLLLAGITVGSIVLSVVAIGLLTIWAAVAWVIVDAFLIPGLIREHNEILASSLAFEMTAAAQAAAEPGPAVNEMSTI